MRKWELPSTGVQFRDNAFHRFEGIVRDIAPRLDEQSVLLLTTYAIASPDGLFIARGKPRSDGGSESISARSSGVT